MTGKTDVIPVIEIPRVAQVTHIDGDIENEPSRPPEVRGGHHSNNGNNGPETTTIRGST
jgi:hypothetical protein